MAKKGAKKKYKACQRKSGANKGKVKKGWRIVNGRCVKAKGKKPKKRTARKRTVKKRVSRAKRKWPTRKYSVKRLAGTNIVQFRTKDGKVIRFNAKNGLRGLAGRKTPQKKSWRYKNLPCVRNVGTASKPNYKVQPGWRVAKNSTHCIPSKGTKKSTAKKSAKKGRTTSAEAKRRNWLAKPCVNSKTGNVKKGFRVAKGTGRCIKAGTKTTSSRSSTSSASGRKVCQKANGKLRKGWRYGKNGICVKAKGGKGGSKKSQAKARSKAKGNRFAPKSKYPCMTKNKPKRLKKGWYIRRGRCIQSKGGAMKTAGYKYPCQIKSGKRRGKIKKGFYIKNGACWTKKTKTKPSKRVLVKGRPTLRGLRIRRR